MLGSHTPRPVRPRPLDFAVRLLVASAIVLSALHLYQRTIIEPFVPAFGDAARLLAADFVIVSADVAQEGPNETVRIRANLRFPSNTQIGSYLRLAESLGTTRLVSSGLILGRSSPELSISFDHGTSVARVATRPGTANRPMRTRCGIPPVPGGPGDDRCGTVEYATQHVRSTRILRMDGLESISDGRRRVTLRVCVGRDGDRRGQKITGRATQSAALQDRGHTSGYARLVLKPRASNRECIRSAEE